MYLIHNTLLGFKNNFESKNLEKRKLRKVFIESLSIVKEF